MTIHPVIAPKMFAILLFCYFCTRFARSSSDHVHLLLFLLFITIQGTLLQSTMPNFPQVFSQNNSTTGTTDSSSPGRGTPSMQTQPTQALNLPQMFGANFPNNGNQTVTTNIPNKLSGCIFYGFSPFRTP